MSDAAPSEVRPPRSLQCEEDLRSIIPEPTKRVLVKIQKQLDAGARSWIEAASLVGVATRGTDGGVDVGVRRTPTGSPRPRTNTGSSCAKRRMPG